MGISKPMSQSLPGAPPSSSVSSLAGGVKFDAHESAAAAATWRGIRGEEK
jgi:hypothetical protein